MTEENKENINDINIEQKPIEAFKDNIKKENISDIKIKNQSLQNNTNSYSKSFDSEKNDNKEKEFININNINNINNKKESKFKLKKEEINELINNNKNKYNNKNKKCGLIKRANKKPEIEPHSKFNLNNALKKIRNKSVEKKIKDLLSIDKKKTNNVKEKNKFINKLKEIEVKIEGIKDLKKRRQKEEKIVEFKNDKKNKENIDNNKDKDNFINFNFELKKESGNSENKYQELKKLYFSCNKFDFTPTNKKIVKENRNNKDKSSENKIKNNTNNYKSYIEFKHIYKKKCDQPNTIKQNQAINDLNRNQNRKINKKSNFDFFKSVSIEKSSKFKHIMDDVCSEIKDLNNYSSRRNYRSKISNIKSYIKNSFLYKGENNFDIKKQGIINYCDYNKSKDLDFDDLLNLCSKRIIK